MQSGFFQGRRVTLKVITSLMYILNTITQWHHLAQRDRRRLNPPAKGDRTSDLLKNPEIIDQELCYVAQTKANVKDIASWVGNSSTIGRKFISTLPF